MKSLVLIIAVSSLLLGCSNQPRHVEASMPLVTKNIAPIGDRLPEKYQNILEDRFSDSLNHSVHNIHLSPMYTSSLGNDCRELHIQTPNGLTSKRIVCAEKKQHKNQVRAWYVIPDIVHSSSSSQLRL